MKLNKKMVMISAAALMMVAPALTTSQNLTITVQAADVETESNQLQINITKSYVYNNKGTRTTYKGQSTLKYGSHVDYLGKISDYNGKNKYYIKDNKGYKKFASYKNIKGKAYFQIGKNAYVRVVNVGQVNGHPLYAKYMNVTVSPKNLPQKRGQYVYDSDNNIIKGVYFKPNQKLTIDGQKYVINGNHVNIIYRVKGTNHYVYRKDLKTRVNQRLEDLSGVTHIRFNSDTKIYTGNGELKTKTPNTSTRIDFNKGQSAEVDRLLYLWVPSENKAELFYRLKSSYSQTGSTYSPSDDAGFVKASDVDYDYGPQMVDPENTASEAEADKAIATSTDKSELNSLVSEDVLNTNLYKLSATNQQWNYAGALQNAKEVNDSKTATINVVKQATWELEQAKKALTGEKVKVDNLGWIDYSTASKIVSVAKQAYPDTQTTSYSLSMVNHNTVLRMKEYALEKGQGNIGHVKAVKELNINDFVTVTDPNPTEKSGYQSSLSEKNLADNATLKKYADLIDYNELTTNLVAKTDTPIYTNSYKNNYANVSKGNVKLTRTSQIIKKGNNIGYNVGPIVKVNGQYYAMVRGKKRYFYVRADAIGRENFTKNAAYKKYNKMITDAMKDNYRGNIKVTAKQNTVTYERNSYGELSTKTRPFKKGQSYNLTDAHVMKLNGEWYFIMDYPTYSGTTYLANTVELSKQD
ncbi:SLAP domain-containing protein [Lactobacillus intestinalis]|uniref:Serine protease n=1 Tax=Lactobacillus intestinalis TaxID=151781 RepID=A0A4S2BNH4_9LACO|nr:serine protease [Lactobacillus intestinalis]TGY15755.1 serine protease [Lactobacillus intestinalis]